jgi:hypothetical protein
VAFYDLTRARIFIEREEYDLAEWVLERVVDRNPDYEPAWDLLEWLEKRHEWLYWEKQWERDLAWREKVQRGLTTLEPSLADALPLYTKEGLTGMAREVEPEPGWSSLRKAELVDAIIEALRNRMKLKWMVRRLAPEEWDALRAVLDRGGAMEWDAFETRYGSDLEESRYWQWHTPESTMGQLRLHGLLVEATVDEELYVVVPVDLREPLRAILG